MNEICRGSGLEVGEELLTPSGVSITKSCSFLPDLKPLEDAPALARKQAQDAEAVVLDLLRSVIHDTTKGDVVDVIECAVRCPSHLFLDEVNTEEHVMHEFDDHHRLDPVDEEETERSVERTPFFSHLEEGGKDRQQNETWEIQQIVVCHSHQDLR
jgi:hypothetical protein